MDERIIDQKDIQPEPSYGLPVAAVLETPKEDSAVVDAKTFTFLVYALYKTNSINRIGVRDLLDLIKRGNHPKDITEYLMSEVKKI